MWYITNYRPTNSSIALFLLLLISSIFITLHQKGFSSLSYIEGEQIPSYKTNPSNLYFHIQLDIARNTAKCQPNDNLIIYILSTITNFQRRKFIRSTWASPLMGTCFVFIVGQSPNPSSDQIRINYEKRQHYDIIQVNHKESYANVIYKEIAALEWSSHFYPSIPYLFKTDDDLIIDSFLILSIVQILITNVSHEKSYISSFRPTLVSSLLSSDRSTFFRGGWSMGSQPAIRQASKFYVNESVWPYPLLPLYCSGFGWLMSNTTRNRLVNATYTYPVKKIVWIGDVFLSGFLAKAANVSCIGMGIDYEQTSSTNCSCLLAERPMLTVCSSGFHLAGGGKEVERHNEYLKSWEVIKKRHGLISNSTGSC
jgi:hypothetical protein